MRLLTYRAGRYTRPRDSPSTKKEKYQLMIHILSPIVITTMQEKSGNYGMAGKNPASFRKQGMTIRIMSQVNRVTWRNIITLCG